MTKGAAAYLADGAVVPLLQNAAIIRAWNTRTERGREVTLQSITDWIGEGRSGETICVTRIEGERMRTNELAGERQSCSN